jgi:hypothetical protein
MEQLAQDRGLAPVPQQRVLEHYGWLVRAAVLGQSWAEIARSNPMKVDPPAVKRGAERLAGRIGLPLAPRQPGRPRGAKN